MPSRVASRYVKSLFTLAQERGVIEPIHEDMLLFSRVARDNRMFALMLRNPILKTDQKMRILKAVFTGKVDVLTLSFLSIVCQKGREAILPQIAGEFETAYDAFKSIGKATVTSASRLDGKIRKEVERMAIDLTARKTIELEERLDPELIGGFVLHTGDKQIDASVRGKLKALRIRFEQNPSSKV